MTNNTIKTRALVEASIMSAIIFIFVLIGVYVPFLYTVCMFVLPIPITLLYLRYNYKIAISSIVVSTVMVSLIYSPLPTITVAITYSLVGFFLGYSIKNKKKVSVTIGILTLSIIAGLIVKFLIASLFIEKTTITAMIQQVIDYMKESMQFAKEIYIKAGIPKEQVSMVDQMFSKVTVEMILMVLPAYAIISGILQACLNYIITGKVLKRLGYKIEPIRPFSRIYVPNLFAAFLIIILCIGVILSSKNIKIGEYILQTTYPLVNFTFVIDGVAAVVYFLRKHSMSKGIIIAIILFTLFNPVTSQLYFSIGIVDIILNLRGLDPKGFKRKKLED